MSASTVSDLCVSWFSGVRTSSIKNLGALPLEEEDFAGSNDTASMIKGGVT
jgi:hypothetical protein